MNVNAIEVSLQYDTTELSGTRGLYISDVNSKLTKLAAAGFGLLTHSAQK